MTLSLFAGLHQRRTAVDFKSFKPEPLALTEGKAYILTRFAPEPDHTAREAFGVRLFTAKAATSV